MAGYITSDDTRHPDAQIIVTVPQILRLMLLNGEVSSEDTSAVVLDEIHSIGQDEGGAVWEHVLTMLPTPVRTSTICVSWLLRRANFSR